MNEPRRSVGDAVLDDLNSLLKEGKVSSVTSPLRSISSPARVAKSMVQGAGKTIAEQKETITRLEQERKSGSLLVLLDPKDIAHSKFVNRHALSLSTSDSEFSELVESLRTQGQDQAILVRPAPPEAEHGKPYEIAFGHRRHAAALIIDEERQPDGWKIKAYIKELNDLDLVAVMDRENAQRKDISPYEIGWHFLKCLQEGIYSSQRDISRHRGLSNVLVHKYIQVAELDEAILSAFGDPRAIRLRWIQELQQALSSNKEEVLKTARALANGTEKHTPEEVLNTLIEGPNKTHLSHETSARKARAEEQIFRLPGSKKVGLKLVTKIVPKQGATRIKWGFGIDVDYQKQFAGALKAFIEKHLEENPPPETPAPKKSRPT